MSSKKQIEVNILDQQWKIRFSHLRSDKDGWCDNTKKEIIIHNKLPEKREMEILLHEYLHSSDWHKDEDSWIVPVARDLTDIMWRLGYRRDKDKSEL